LVNLVLVKLMLMSCLEDWRRLEPPGFPSLCLRHWKGGYVKRCLRLCAAWLHFTVVINANRFRNVSIARSTLCFAFYAPPCILS